MADLQRESGGLTLVIPDKNNSPQKAKSPSGKKTPTSAEPSSLKDDGEMEAMRRRMEAQNVIGEIEIKESIASRLTEKLKACWKKMVVKSAVFSEHFEETKKTTSYDIRSLWILHGDWWIRRKLVWFIEWKPFENFITLVILANSVMLACTDYNERIFGEDYISIANLNMAQVDTAFSIIFLFECIVKILAMGFIFHSNSYMRDTWNWLDFFVVAISVVTWMPGIEGNSSMKSLRTFRILRPLRSINSLPSMKALIQSLLSSLPGLVNVFIFLAFIFTIFAIFGTHQFVGAHYSRCRETLTPIPEGCFGDACEYWNINFDAEWLCKSDSDCERMLGDGKVHKCGKLLDYGMPKEKDQPELQKLILYDIVNFNNVPLSLFTIFQCLTLEGWTTLMYNYMDCNNSAIAVGYFCFMVIFGSFFAMQLVLANIMDSFAKDQESKKAQIVDEEIHEEKTNQLAGLFINAGKKKPVDVEKQEKEEKKDQVAEVVQSDNPIIDLNKEPTIANNAEIKKELRSKDANLANEKPKVDEANIKIDLSEDEFSQDANLNEWITNKKETHPDFEQQLDSDSEFEDETRYEIAARDRSKTKFIYRKVYALINHPIYNFIVFVLILANTIVLAVDDYPQSLQKEAVLSGFNDFFTWIFFVEMIIKIVGLGLNNYVHDKFNLFDAVVVSLSLIDWFLAIILTTEQKKSVGSSMQALRALRLLRVIKLARSWTALQDILGKTIRSLKDISNFGVLLFLFLYIFALLGMEMFSNQIRLTYDEEYIKDIPAWVKEERVMIAPRYNFDNIYNALIVVFCGILGEDWNNSMYSFINPKVANQYIVMGYFISLLIIGNIMLLSLFTAILLQNFEDNEEDQEVGETAPKSEFSIKMIFTKAMLVKIKDAFLSIFDPKGKKKAHKNRELSASQANLNSSQPNQVSNTANNPASLDLSKQDLPKILQQEAKKINNPTANIALLHYELNENAISVLASAKVKSARIVVPDLPQLQGNSLFVFGPSNTFRIGCHIISNHKYFTNFIILLIGISTICLALQTPLDDPNGQQTIVLNYIDFVMTGFFICEMLTGIVARGFAICGKESYIRNGWNVLDFIIVCSATISVIFSTIDLGFIKSLRVMRVLRPLRLLAKHRGLKLAISALFNSLPNILNLLLIVMFFIFMLAILQTTLFAGQFWHCDTEHLNLDDYMAVNGITTRYECLLFGGEWVNPDFMYDNTLRSMLTLVSIQSTEGWVDTMWQTIDVMGQELQPVRDAKRFYCVFCILCQVGMTLLFLNLFVGVVIDSFNNEKEELSLNKLLKKVQKTWIETLQLCYTAKPMISTPKTNQLIRDFMIDFCNSKKFDNFILICILGNTLQLTIIWYGMHESIVDQLEIVNYVFSSIFTLEAILKIIAYRKNYFREAWNKFDFSVVVLTWFVVIVMSIELPFDQNLIGILGTIARTLRIGRVFRLVKRVPAIAIILQTLMEALPAISALGLLLGLLFFLYSIIGISQFAFVTLSGELNDHVNFQSFINGVLLLMRNATGEAWDTIMFDCMRQRSITFQCEEDVNYYSWKNNGEVMNGCGSMISILYFYSFTVIVSQIFLNLFIAIIIDSFLGQSQAYGMPVNQADIDDFIEVWQTFDPEGEGTLECYNLERFVCKLSLTQSKLIANKRRILQNVTLRRKYIAQLEIPSHHDFGIFMFTDTLQCMARLVVESSYIRDECSASKREMSQQQMMLNNNMGVQKVNTAIKSAIDLNVPEVKRDHKVDFRNITNSISSLNKNIASVNELLKTASKMKKSALGKIDINKLEEDSHEIYSSKHYVYGELIVRCWRDFLKAKAGEIQHAEELRAFSRSQQSQQDEQQSQREEDSKTELIKIDETASVNKQQKQ